MSSILDFKMTLSAIRRKALLMVDDPLGERFDKETVDRAINDSALELAVRAEAVKDEIELTLRPAQSKYNVRAAINEFQGAIREFAYQKRIGRDGYDYPAIAPQLGFTLGYVSPGWIEIVEIPYVDGTIQVVYVAAPRYMTEDTDYPDVCFPAEFHEVIAHGAASKLLEYGGSDDLDVSVRLYGEFNSGVGRLVTEGYRRMIEGDHQIGKRSGSGSSDATHQTSYTYLILNSKKEYLLLNGNDRLIL